MTMTIPQNVRPEPSDWLTRHTLSGLLRNELTAADRCRIALDSLVDPRIEPEIIGCRRSHLARSHMLAQELVRQGGRPPQDVGVRGAFATLVQRAASSVSDDLALANLRRTERRNCGRYTTALRKLAYRPHRLVRERLLPEQQRVHRVLTQLDVTETV